MLVCSYVRFYGVFVLLKWRVTYVSIPLPVDYSRLKTDDTSGLKNYLLHPLFHSSLVPLRASPTSIVHDKGTSTGSEFCEAWTPTASHFFCGSSSLGPLAFFFSPSQKQQHHQTVLVKVVGTRYILGIFPFPRF